MLDRNASVAGKTRPSHVRAWIALYSLVVAGLLVSMLDARPTVPIMSTRAADVSASIAVVERGGPPLLASDVPYFKGISPVHLRPAGQLDDEGIYVYLPQIAKYTGQNDPAILMKWLFMGSFATLFLVLPLMLYEIFGSVVVAAAAPLVVYWKFAWTGGWDLYWILAWAVILGIPALVVAHRWWADRRGHAIGLLVATMVTASYATSIRVNAGLPLLLGALGIVFFTGVGPHPWRRLTGFWRTRSWWVRPVAAAGLVLAYLSIATFGFAGLRAYRNHVIHQPNFGSQLPNQHPVWHNAYIGLGYLPNPYGIEWNDAVAADAVERTRPGTAFLSAEYGVVLRHLYERIARHDPGFVADNFWQKFRWELADAGHDFWPALVLLPAAWFAGARRRSMRCASLVAVPAVIIGLLGPMMTMPYKSYELAWLGTCGALFMLAIGWLYVSAKQWYAALPPELEPLRTRPDPVALAFARRLLFRQSATWAALLGLVAAFLVVEFARPAPAPSSVGMYTASQGSFVDAREMNKPALVSWTFGGTLPKGWRNVGAAYLQRDGIVRVLGFGTVGLYVRSGMTTDTDLLAGPWFKLPAGSYSVRGLGRPLAGGFKITVRAAGRILSTSGYWSQQPQFAAGATDVPFKISAPTRVRISLSNWSAFPTASAWVIWRLNVYRTG